MSRFHSLLARVVILSLVASICLLSIEDTHAETFTDPGFVSELVATLAPFTLVGMAFAPDGRLFVWQKNGVVRVIKNGAAAADAVHRPQRQGEHLRRPRLLGPGLRPETSPATATST